MVVGMERFGVAIPPVVARIFSGDSTSPLTRDGHGCPKLNAQRLCTDAKPTERSYGKDDSAFRGIVRFFERSMLVQL